MDIGRIVIDFGNCLVEMLTTVFFFAGLAKQRVSWKITAAVTVACTLAFTAWLTGIGHGRSTFFFSLLLTFFISLCYSFRVYTAAFLSLLLSVLSAATETIIGLLITACGLSVEETTANPLYYILGILLTKVLNFLIIIVIHKGAHRFGKSTANPSPWLLVTPLATLVVVQVLDPLVHPGVLPGELLTKWPQMILIATLIVMSSLNVALFFAFTRKNELSATRQKLEMSRSLLLSQRQYYGAVFASQQEIRRLRHDLKHVFLAVLAEIDEGDTQGARRLVQAQLSEAEREIDFRGREGEDMLSSIVYSKQLAAKKRGVTLNSTLDIGKNLFLDSLDLTVLTANLLDNAIEAAAQLEEESARQVELTILTQGENLIVTVKNAVAQPVEIERIEAGQASRPGHGFGLLSVKAIIEKYAGNYGMTCQNNRFAFTAIMHNHEQAL